VSRLDPTLERELAQRREDRVAMYPERLREGARAWQRVSGAQPTAPDVCHDRGGDTRVERVLSVGDGQNEVCARVGSVERHWSAEIIRSGSFR
jgi:hypothetical protein